jgi:LmbE family N-acetylglucosaminyl deacetylase
MSFIADGEHLGTPAEEWSRSPRFAASPILDLSLQTRVVVIAPHPDDEILGAGGLLQHLCSSGTSVLIVAVTDGEASHPDSDLVAKLDLRAIREKESRVALRRLGTPNSSVVRLRIPDGRVTQHLEVLEAELERLLEPTDLCLAPWVNEGHPDHDTCGIAARNATRAIGSELLHYLVWTLHWASPTGNDLPWDSCRRYELSVRELTRKRRATLAFRSQTRTFGKSAAGAPVLPLAILRRHWLGNELFIDPESTASPSLLETEHEGETV